MHLMLKRCASDVKTAAPPPGAHAIDAGRGNPAVGQKKPAKGVQPTRRRSDFRSVF